MPLKGFATPENSLDEKQTARWTSDTIQIFSQPKQFESGIVCDVQLKRVVCLFIQLNYVFCAEPDIQNIVKTFYGRLKMRQLMRNTCFIKTQHRRKS